METLDRALTYLITGGCGVIVGLYFGLVSFVPQSVYQRDLNGDGRADIVMRNNTQNDIIFLQQEDGTYVSLDTIQVQNQAKSKEERKTLEEKAKDIQMQNQAKSKEERKTIEEKAKDIE